MTDKAISSMILMAPETPTHYCACLLWSLGTLFCLLDPPVPRAPFSPMSPSFDPSARPRSGHRGRISSDSALQDLLPPSRSTALIARALLRRTLDHGSLMIISVARWHISMGTWLSYKATGGSYTQTFA